MMKIMDQLMKIMFLLNDVLINNLSIQSCFSCQFCGNIFTCKVNMLCYQIQNCDLINVNARDAESDRDYEKSNNMGDFSSIDLVTIIYD